MVFYDVSDNHPLSIPSISSLYAILAASAATLAVDATIHMFRRRSQDILVVPQRPCPPLTQFATKTRQILDDVQTLEKQLTREHIRRRKIHLQYQASHDRQLITRVKSTRQGNIACLIESPHKGQMSNEFTAFCERLLFMNQIWKQEKELKTLRTALESEARARASTAFNNFCERLLLWNRVWELEREVKALVEEGEKLKRARVAAITRAAKRMVLDVQKERLVEEFVKDLIAETAASKQEVTELKMEHQREIEEVHADWMRDYRRVTRELEILKLAQAARLAEQDVGNTVEDSLYESLRAGKRRLETLEETIEEYRKESCTSQGTSQGAYELHRSANDNEDEETLSELSSSSTCVSFGGPVRGAARVTSSMVGPRLGKRRISNITTSQNTIFKNSPFFDSKNLSGGVVEDSELTLKPSVAGQTDSLSTLEDNIAAIGRTRNSSEKPLAVRNRIMTLRLSRSRSAKKETLAVRVPWR